MELKPKIFSFLSRLPQRQRRRGRNSHHPDILALPWSPLDVYIAIPGFEEELDIWAEVREVEREEEARALQKELWALNGDRVVDVGRAWERADGVTMGALGFVLTILGECEKLMEECWARLGRLGGNKATSKTS